MKKLGILLTVLVMAMLTLTACGGDKKASGENQVVNVELNDEYKIKLDKTDVKVGSVTFKVKNSGAIVHNFVTGGQTLSVPAGQSAELTVTYKEAGDQKLVCTEAGHEALGMHTTLKVGK